jgi:predicted  nucleic acid-binding Zn-ribbon protein
LRELEYWSAKVGDPRCESEVAARVIDLLVRSRVDLHYAVEDLTLRGEGLTRQRDNLSRELVATRHHCEMVRHASELAIQEARQRSRDRIRDDISELLAALPLQIEAWTLPLRSHTETVDRLVEERESLIATVASVRAELVALQAQIGDVELQRAKLERERGELLAIIRSVEAGVLWRLRALLLKLPGVASLLRGYQQWRREPQVTHPKPS